ncbi:MAG: tRNA (N6-threonylcarbamoyladenosine(37)-N6)-methyltransferase TrmO [Lachnospiraceae bacterium]
MSEKKTLDVIAYIETDFPEKFGIPRQSGLVDELTGKIVFEPKYRSVDAVKGLEGFDYIWLLWEFQNVTRKHWSATVKPPRLGGNTCMGVFATRSPFRPNGIGLSCVKLDGIEETKEGPVLYVSGIDLRSGTPIYDIKPYLPTVDSHPEARGGFAEIVADYELQVDFPKNLLERFPKEKQNGIIGVLKQDPRPSYHEDNTRKYGVSYCGKDVHFTVDGNLLKVFDVVDIEECEEDYKVNLKNRKKL